MQMNEDYVIDGFGNIDDFRAPAGKVGSQLSRRLMLQTIFTESLVSHLHELKDQGFCKTLVFDTLLQTLESVYEGTVPTYEGIHELRTGDLVKHKQTGKIHLIMKTSLKGTGFIYLSDYLPNQVHDAKQVELVSENR
jgi:hypothetical protein